MREMLDKLWVGAKCRWCSFVDDFKHEEKGAAEIVAIILVVVVIIAAVALFKDRIITLIGSVFDKTDEVTTSYK